MSVQEELLEAISRAQSTFISTADVRTAFEGLLKDVLRLSGSEYGFIGEVHHHADGAPYLKTHAITNISWDDQTRTFYERHAPNGLEFSNLQTLFGRALTTRQTVIANAPKQDPRAGGLPSGHPPLDAFLGIPIHAGEHLVAMLGIANRPGGYDHTIVEFLRPLTATIGQLVEARRSRETLRDLEHKLWAAQKMEAVGQLAGGVAHDFNNMLQVIRSYCQLALAETVPESMTETCLQQIEAAVDRSASLVSQLLAFSRRQTTMPGVFRPSELVESLIPMLRRLVPESIQLEFTCTEPLPSVRIDQIQFDQILTNLVINAAAAIEGRGCIRISATRQRHESVLNCSSSVLQPGDYVILTVTDDGCGMDESTLSRIFEPFFTTRAGDAGHGLGLATVLGIVRQNHGAVNVQSEPGCGSTVEVLLPACRDEPRPAVQVRTNERPARGTEQILFVEDEVSILEPNQRFLQDLGYDVLAVSQPGDAVLLAKKHADSIRLLVTDVIMPGITGRELFERVQTLIPNLPCLYISGFTADVIARHGVLDDRTNLLHKPFRPIELANRVREVLDQSHVQESQRTPNVGDGTP